jgi:RNA polymerase sigma-70 factor (ECF subfamily)
MQTDPENEIIARVKAGMTNEFEHLVRRYQAPLFRIVANLVDRVAVEDIVQDVFLTAFSQIHRFDPRRGAFRTWLYRIARNRALNARRKKRERLMQQQAVIADGPAPDGDLLTREAFRQLDHALARLDFKDRVIFVLAELEGLSYAQIAEVESLPLGTVKSRLHRVREKLRQALAPYME